MVACVLAHDMDDDVKVVEDYPGRFQGAIGCAGANSWFELEALGDFINDGAQVRFAGTGANDEIIRDG